MDKLNDDFYKYDHHITKPKDPIAFQDNFVKEWEAAENRYNEIMVQYYKTNKSNMK